MNIICKKMLLVLCCFCIVCAGNGSMVFFAAEEGGSVQGYENVYIEIENDVLLEGATEISSESHIEDGRLITKKIYELKDGTIVTDEMSVSAISTLSAEGEDSVSRRRTISGWGTISLSATFEWYRGEWASYVRCKSMGASYSMPDQAVCSEFVKDWTREFVTVGVAKAQVEYKFYNKEFPLQFISGTFAIKCTDNGTISDNG